MFEDLGRNLHYWRKFAGHTKHELALRLPDTTVDDIFCWESGVSRPSDSILVRMAEIYEIGYNVLMEGVE